MAHKIIHEFSCDKCQEKPSEKSNMYGWLMLTPYHLTTNNLGHNSIPSDSIILCPICWPKMVEFLKEQK